MRRRHFLAFGTLGLLAACVPREVEPTFRASAKSAVELRAMQSRVFAGDPDTMMRSVIATLHDLGYRITRAEPEAGTVTAAKRGLLRLTAVVRQREPGRVVVRANAVVPLPGVETQVDDPEFYLRNFFTPLAETIGAEAFAAPNDDSVPDAVRPEREADLRRRAEPVPTQEPQR